MFVYGQGGESKSSRYALLSQQRRRRIIIIVPALGSPSSPSLPISSSNPLVPHASPRRPSIVLPFAGNVITSLRRAPFVFRVTSRQSVKYVVCVVESSSSHSSAAFATYTQQYTVNGRCIICVHIYAWNAYARVNGYRLRGHHRGIIVQ